MSATTDRPAPAAATAGEAPPRAAPLARTDGLDLLGEVGGSGYRDGAALVRRADGQMVQLGPLMYALLEEIDGRRDVPALATALTERIGRLVEPEHVVRLAEKLHAQGLLAGSEANAPPRVNPLLALRWKVLVTDPKVTRRITAPFMWLFRRWMIVPVLAGFAAVCWFVLFHKGIASATAQAFHSPELLLLVLGLGVASAAFHEIGHASACRFGGARPGGMGAGIYLVWPAFYTDVTDAYRLPRGARLRTDLGGLYFNAVIAVVTLGAWLLVRADVLLLLIGLQLLEMVKNLSPVIRSDGYHVLADATGVPDLYAHIGPTLRRLLPWRPHEPSALTGRARALVTVWVLIVVPVLLSMAFTAILVLPRLAASTWASGSHLASLMPQQAGDGQIPALLASVVRMFALALPVVGTVLMAQRTLRSSGRRALAWSAGSTPRRAVVVAATAALVGLLAWAWWPSGQYRPVRATDRGTLQSAAQLVVAPATAVRPAGVAMTPIRLAPGRHVAVALIPEGGASKQHPAIFVIKGGAGQRSAVIVTPKSPGTTGTPQFQPASAGSGAASPSSSPPPPASAPTTTAPGTAFPFILPDGPGPNDSQALATNGTDHGVKYDVVYSIVTVSGGAPVDETNSAYALASCTACTTVAVSFQLVLVVGQSNTIMPVNIAEALNNGCVSCVTTAVADQIVVTVSAQPSDQLMQQLTQALQKLDALSALGASGTPAAIAAGVLAVQKEIEQDLADSGLETNPPAATATATPSPSPVPPRETATPGHETAPTTAPASGATPAATADPVPTATPAASATPAATATATATPSATATP